MHYRQAIYVSILEAFSQVDMQKLSSQSFTEWYFGVWILYYEDVKLFSAIYYAVIVKYFFTGLYQL